MDLQITKVKGPIVPKTIWQKQFSPFQAAMQRAVEAHLTARSAAIALCTSKQTGLPTSELREVAEKAHAELDEAQIAAYEAATTLAEKLQVYRSAIEGSRAKGVIFDRMAEMAWQH